MAEKADNNVRSVKNPLLSANITGFSIDDLTQNPVLLPVQPKPMVPQQEQTSSTQTQQHQTVQEEVFSEISLDPDTQETSSVSQSIDKSYAQANTQNNPLLDVDSAAKSPLQNIDSSSSGTGGASAFSQVTNQASQLSAQLSQLPSVASSVLSSFSSILGRGGNAPANQQKEPEVYKSPLDTLLTDCSTTSQNPGLANAVPLLPANQNSNVNPERPNPVGETPPPIPLYSSGQISSTSNQKPIAGSGNAFRLGGIKKKTYAQIPGLNTSHVSQLFDAPLNNLQSNATLPQSTPAQTVSSNFYSTQPTPNPTIPPANLSQSVPFAVSSNNPQSELNSAPPLPANFFQQAANNFPPTSNLAQTSNLPPPSNLTPTSNLPPTSNIPPTSNNSLTLNSSSITNFPPTTTLQPVTNFPPTTNFPTTANLPPAANLPPETNLPPTANLAPVTNLPPTSSFPPTSNFSSTSNLNPISNLPPTTNLPPATNLPSVTALPSTTNLPPNTNLPPTSNYPQSSNYPSYGNPQNTVTSAVQFFNPQSASVPKLDTSTPSPIAQNQPPVSFYNTPVITQQQQQLPSPNITPPVANLPPPPTQGFGSKPASNLFPVNQPPAAISSSRNPFSIHSLAKNQSATSTIKTSENIAIFTPTFSNPAQPSSNVEVKNTSQAFPPPVSENKPQIFNPYNTQEADTKKVDSSFGNTENQKKNFNETSPYLTISPESEQSVLRSLTPLNSKRSSVHSDISITDKDVHLATESNQQQFQQENNQRNISQASNTSSVSSYFAQSSEGNSLLTNPEVKSSDNKQYFVNNPQPTTFFTACANAGINPTVASGQAASLSSYSAPPQNSQVSNFVASNLAGSSTVANNKNIGFPAQNLGNMEDNAANEVLVYQPVTHHWFHKKEMDNKVIWTPFSLIDSTALERALQSGEKNVIVATDGGRYDVNVSERTRSPVYWAGEVTNVRRCSWFFKAIDSRFMPYEENTADLLESEYRNCTELNTWHRRIELPQGEAVMLHGPTVLVHFLRSADSADSWGNSPQTANRPRVVKRGIEEFEIDKGEPTVVDHLLFLVHGIGSVCDLKFRTVEEVVDEFRGISLQLVQSHYRTACERGNVNRIEVLPISWHGSLHSSETGIDDKLKAITLESIPKLREFTNGTLLDVLFYTSPVFCQNIMHTVGNELNRLYTLFQQRNPGYNGGVSLGGHSLGSLILFDLLCHQNPPQDQNGTNRSVDTEIETQEDDKAMPLNERRPLKRTLSKRINYVVGHAGTGQPFIKYPQLCFHPNTFFALGSPLGMFVTVRGIDTLGLDFALPTCPGFFNIFHPYDPVAYRVEALINPALKSVRPVLIPHHKGRKRMHLELKETMSRVGADLKNRLMDSVKSTWNSVYQIAMFKGTQTLDDVVDKALRQELQMKYSSNSSFDSDGDIKPDDDSSETSLPLGKLNGGRRMDYVLQEAPLEFFNEYLFALTSHVCYWESEDTMLIIIKEIYSSLGVTTDSQIPQQTMTIERPVYSIEQNLNETRQNSIRNENGVFCPGPETTRDSSK